MPGFTLSIVFINSIGNSGALTKGPLTVTVTYVTVMNVNPEPLMNDWNVVVLSAEQDFIFDSATITNKEDKELFNYQRDLVNPEDIFNQLSFKYESSIFGDLSYLSIKVNLIHEDSFRSKTMDFDLGIIDNRYTLSESGETELEENMDLSFEYKKSSDIDLEADLELVEILPD